MRDGRARVLIADDNKVNLLLMARNVQLLGHQTALAEDGAVALRMLRDNDFDLLLLDISMPEMDGFEVLRHLVADLRLRDVPVIVTSALEGLDGVVRSSNWVLTTIWPNRSPLCS